MKPLVRSSLGTLEPFRRGEPPPRPPVLNLATNESPYGPSANALAAFQTAAASLAHYADPFQSELRQAIATVHGVDATRIVCGNGSDERLQLLLRAYVGPGDEVVFSRYSFGMAMVHATALGATVVIADQPTLKPDPASLLAAITPRTRAVFIASPNNPVGQYLPAGELAQLVAGVPEEVLLVLDGAYADFVNAPDYDWGAGYVDQRPNVVATRTFSKLHGLASLRVGWLYGPVEVIDAIQRIRTPFNTSGPALAAATAAALDAEYALRIRAATERERLRFTQTVGKISGIEVCASHTNFCSVTLPDRTTRCSGSCFRFDGQRYPDSVDGGS
jgi:histidinol-phosphate aminotransferase